MLAKAVLRLSMPLALCPQGALAPVIAVWVIEMLIQPQPGSLITRARRHHTAHPLSAGGNETAMAFRV